jgi:hypothetical protein
MASSNQQPVVPSDGAVALRSFPRRYRSLVLPALDPVVEALAHQVGPEGVSAVELVADTVRTWLIQREAMRQTQIHDFPLFHPAVLHADQRHWHNPVLESADSALAQLEDLATEFADDINAIHGDAWFRSGTVAGGESVTALQLLEAAVNVGADNLRQIERTLAAIRN